MPLAGGGRIAYANLDHGASAPALRVVKDTVDALLERYASVHRGAGWHSKICTELYEGAREPMRDFVGGRTDDAVIFTRHTTDSFNLLAHCLPARTTVVVFETEHHAALLPWDAARGPRPSSGCRAPDHSGEAIDCRRRCAPPPGARPRAAGDHRRVERHRRAVAGGRTGRRCPVPRRPDRAGRGATRAAPAVLDRRTRRRLRRAVRAQALRALRGRRPGRPGRLAGGGPAVPDRRRRNGVRHR